MNGQVYWYHTTWALCMYYCESATQYCRLGQETATTATLFSLMEHGGTVNHVHTRTPPVIVDHVALLLEWLPKYDL